MHFASARVKLGPCEVHARALTPAMRHASSMAKNSARVQVFVDKLLRTLMAEHHLDRTAMAERLDISDSLLGNLLGRSRPASFSVQNAISEGFGLSLDAIKGFDVSESLDLEPSRQISEPGSGQPRIVRLDSYVEDDGNIRGPLAHKYGADDPDIAELGRLTDYGHMQRGEPEEFRHVQVVNVPIGVDILDVRATFWTMDGDRVQDHCGPGWVLYVEPGNVPARDDEDLVIAVHPGNKTEPAQTRLVRYRPGERGLVNLWPLDWNPKGVVNLLQGWRVTGRVVERGNPRTVDHRLRG